MDVELKFSKRENVQIVFFTGKLVYQNIKAAKEQLEQMQINDIKGYVLDMTEIEKIDSTGFGLLINILKRVPEDSKLVCVVKDPVILELFKITKIQQIIDIYDNVEKAVLAVNR